MNTQNKTAAEALAEVALRDVGDKEEFRITKRSITSGRMNQMTFMARREDYLAWRNGTLIQEAMPYLSTVEREFLISGMSAQEQEDFFDAEDA